SSDLDWRSVKAHNRIGDEYRIPPGTVVTIPVRLLKSVQLAARIISFKGTGRVEMAGKASAVAVGMQILPGNVIETGATSFVTLELSNGSRISLPSQTRIRITAMRRFLLTDSVDFDFLVEKGRIETNATPLENEQGRYRIRTPIAVSAVRGTTFRVAYDGEDKPSLTEVIEGNVGVNAGRNADETSVAAGFGAGVGMGGRIITESLLAPPQLLEPGKVQVDPLVSLMLEPTVGARAYHAQLARDAGFVEIVQESYSDTPKLNFSDVGNGRWFVRITAIAASGLEGMPQTYAMRRVLTGLEASTEVDEDGYRFRWSGSGSGKRIYHFRLRPDRTGAPPLIDEPGLTAGQVTLSDLPPGKYFWRVGVTQYSDGEESVNWLPEQSLIVSRGETAH
ncbi:MAG: FecR domain-containing protein, partial [Sphingobium sp.]